ncbi:MAG: sigma 54-interacting transcriptional regulator [Nitrospirales bacterium]|nr:sigma 54-interacting transcriptional regulator [Nitrospira sp.]MDR4501610.1 sigma 54-interacting transcriptional regulator [Nitrospirales bacterium]
MTALTEALSILVFRQERSSQDFDPVGTIPEWTRLLTGKAQEEAADLSAILLSPFLQHFLKDVRALFTSQSKGKLTSGIWSERGVDDRDYQFEAVAVAGLDCHLLLIQRLGDEGIDIQQVLQTARERGLQHHHAMTEQQRVQRVLGGRLEQSEQLRDDLVAILDRLQLGTIMTDQSRKISFVSQTVHRLLGMGKASVIGLHWKELPVFSVEQRAALEMMLARPARERTKVPIVVEQRKGGRISLEIDIQEDPRNADRTIFFLYDVTEVEDLRGELSEKSRFFDLVGKSRAITDIYKRIEDIAPVEATVLIEGETGTGKELVARAIHEASPRRDGPFIAVNCAGLTDSLLGSQLFGHKRGAFTGATHDHQGFFEAAQAGTLFLDEIGDMPLSIQTTLLRVLQEKEIMRLGESHPRKVDVRVVTATHQNLAELVQTGSFRADLLYRVRVARLSLPTLRDRREDIPLLADVFFRQARTVTKKMDIQEISPDAMQQLLRYRWPGNVRELKSALDYAFIHSRGPAILPADLPPECFEAPMSVSTTLDPELDEREQILAALKRAKGKRALAARMLGMSRSTFYRRLEGFGISSQE